MAEPRTGVGFHATKPGWHHVVTGQKAHHADDCVPDCMLNPDRLHRAALDQLNYEPPIWALDEYMALRHAEQQPFSYAVRVVRTDGLPTDSISLTIDTDPERAITYREYRTGPTPWWKRAWRHIRP